jgi:argonaute-like protein implicated in RNA metabolism and viral defense
MNANLRNMIDAAAAWKHEQGLSWILADKLATIREKIEAYGGKIPLHSNARATLAKLLKQETYYDNRFCETIKRMDALHESVMFYMRCFNQEEEKARQDNEEAMKALNAL